MLHSQNVPRIFCRAHAMLFSFSATVVVLFDIGAHAGVGAAWLAIREWTSSVWLLNVHTTLRERPFTFYPRCWSRVGPVNQRLLQARTPFFAKLQIMRMTMYRWIWWLDVEMLSQVSREGWWQRGAAVR